MHDTPRPAAGSEATATTAAPGHDPAGAAAGGSAGTTRRRREDRDPIASEINDAVIRRLFTAGLSLQSVIALLDGHRARVSIQAAVAELDQAVGSLCDSVFGARPAGLPGRRAAVMGEDTTLSGGDELDMVPVQTAVAVLRKACDNAVDELGGAVPEAQLRALLIIDDAHGSVDLHRLAAELAASVSVTGRLCDRMMAAGLLMPGAVGSGPGSPRPVLTGSGHRLAGWIRDRQRAALSKVLNSMPPQARQALVHGLTDLAAAHQPAG
jgi:hypothetical protein